jgi:hypothetical protein
MAQTHLGSFGTLDWGDWAYGLISGFVSGGASAVTSAFVVSATDPGNDFKFGSPQSLHLMLWVFLVSGLLSAFAFLRSKPLPGLKQTETTTKRIEIEATESKPIPPPPTTITTVKETRVEAVKPDESKEKP